MAKATAARGPEAIIAISGTNISEGVENCHSLHRSDAPVAPPPAALVQLSKREYRPLIPARANLRSHCPLREGNPLGAVAACGSVPAPEGEMSAAQTAVAATEEPPGAQYAPSYFDRARDKLILALAATQEGDTQQAHRLVEQALIDGGRGKGARGGAAQQLHREASVSAAQPLATQ